MPRTYCLAGEEIKERVAAVMGRYHKGLADAGVSLTVLLASGPRDKDGEVTGPAIKVRGHTAMACIKITSLKDRAAGLGDAVLIIDGDNCDTWDERTGEAVLDHECQHIKLKVDEAGAVVRDDLGRPCLKMRQHDVEIGFFHDVASRRMPSKSRRWRSWAGNLSAKAS